MNDSDVIKACNCCLVNIFDLHSATFYTIMPFKWICCFFLCMEIGALMINIITTFGMILQVMALIMDKVKCTGVQCFITSMMKMILNKESSSVCVFEANPPTPLRDESVLRSYSSLILMNLNTKPRPPTLPPHASATTGMSVVCSGP